MSKKLRAALSEYLSDGCELLEDGIGKLHNLANGCIDLRAGGVCINSGLSDDVLRACFETWPHYNGSPNYPVDGELAYHTVRDKWIGDAGALRRDLARHCAAVISYHWEAIRHD